MHETVDTLLSLKIQCTFWPLLVNLLYNVRGWTTKKTTRCLPRNAACNHNLKLTQKKSQQWNQSMVELGGNKSEKQQCVINPMSDITSVPAHGQAMESLWAAAKQPTWQRGASLKIPGNEEENARQGNSTGSQIIAKIKIGWGLNM